MAVNPHLPGSARQRLRSGFVPVTLIGARASESSSVKKLPTPLASYNGAAEASDEALMRGVQREVSDLGRVLRTIMAGLPAPQQQAIDIAFFQGMSQREIAAHTNTPLGTIKTRLELGLKKLSDGLRSLKDEL